MKKNKITTSYLKENFVFFVLYDWYDNLVCYFDNVNELCSFLIDKFKYKRFRVADLAYWLKHSKYDYIQIQKCGNLLKLYCFDDNELFI